MNISVFKISYNTVFYDRPANAPARKKEEQVESRAGFPDRSKVGHSGAMEVLVAAENQQSAIASLPKPSDPNAETNVISVQVLVHDVPLAGSVGTPGPLRPSAADLESRGFTDEQLAGIKRR